MTSFLKYIKSNRIERIIVPHLVENNSTEALDAVLYISVYVGVKISIVGLGQKKKKAEKPTGLSQGDLSLGEHATNTHPTSTPCRG